MLILITAILCFVLGFCSLLIPIIIIFKIYKKDVNSKNNEAKEIKDEETITSEKRDIESQNILKEWLLGGE